MDFSKYITPALCRLYVENEVYVLLSKQKYLKVQEDTLVVLA